MPATSHFAATTQLPATPSQALWDNLTTIIMFVAIAAGAVFAVLTLVQWIKRKSFLKIDRELRWGLLPLALFAAVYVIFEKLWILNFRPNGSGEPSFPSTHTMLTATIFFCIIIILPKYLKSRPLRLTLDALMLVAVVLVSVGRVLANMHWPTDVAGALIFAGIFAVIYNLILRRNPHAKHQTNLNNPTNPGPQIIQPQ